MQGPRHLFETSILYDLVGVFFDTFCSLANSKGRKICYAPIHTLSICIIDRALIHLGNTPDHICLGYILLLVTCNQFCAKESSGSGIMKYLAYA